MKIGSNINKFRKEVRMTQVELAKKLGVKQYAIAKYENGPHNPTPEQIAKIAKTLRVTVCDIYREKSSSKTVIAKAPKNKRVDKIQEIFEKLRLDDQRAVLGHAKGL